MIAAINRFKADNGSYPKSLSVLIPTYLDSIPSATLTLTCRHFTYMDSPSYSLGYCSLWPDRLAHFEFHGQTWHSVLLKD